MTEVVGPQGIRKTEDGRGYLGLVCWGMAVRDQDGFLDSQQQKVGTEQRSWRVAVVMNKVEAKNTRWHTESCSRSICVREAPQTGRVAD